MPNPTDYDTIAARYAAAIDAQPWNALYERPTTLSLLPDIAGKDVLDVGCGGGWYAYWLAERGARVTAIDKSARMTAIARERLGARARVMQADVADLRGTLADASFDLVVASLVLHYVGDLAGAFAECARVLRPGCVIVFSTHHPFDTDGFGAGPRAAANYLQAELIEEEWKWLGPMRYWRRPLRDFTEALTRAGFLIERICEPDPSEAFKAADPRGYARLCRVPAFLFVRARTQSGDGDGR